ncbi:MAG TPA: hypothetical protein VNE63_20895 [Candidatus Acidoferrales bacterium]|nr:hypothetical protein [Candidatus Acidoferrales bacterium]
MPYSVVLVDTNEEDPGTLRRFSKDIGNIAFFPTSLESIVGISKRIARDLREQYTLGFVPKKTDATDSFRKIKVKIDAPGHGKFHVRTWSGYFDAEDKSLPRRGEMIVRRSIVSRDRSIRESDRTNTTSC